MLSALQGVGAQPFNRERHKINEKGRETKFFRLV